MPKNHHYLYFNLNYLYNNAVFACKVDCNGAVTKIGIYETFGDGIYKGSTESTVPNIAPNRLTISNNTFLYACNFNNPNGLDPSNPNLTTTSSIAVFKINKCNGVLTPLKNYLTSLPQNVGQNLVH